MPADRRLALNGPSLCRTERRKIPAGFAAAPDAVRRPKDRQVRSAVAVVISGRGYVAIYAELERAEPLGRPQHVPKPSCGAVNSEISVAIGVKIALCR